jgi:4-amino-4-deoxy-L-arabinose transferase
LANWRIGKLANYHPIGELANWRIILLPMPNLVWGCIIVIACSAGYACAWRQMQAQRYRLALACIMLCGLVLRIYMAADCHLHEWDERYHALVAKHLSQHPLLPTLYEHPLLTYDYRVWTSNHIWLHKQPLSLWLMALSIKLFGLHAFAVRIPAILLSTISIKLIYDIAGSWFDKRTALIAAFLLSINGLIMELAAGRTATDAVDVVFLFFVLLSIWMADKAARSGRLRDHCLLGIAIGLAVLTKWLPALIALPIWALLAYPSFKLVKIKWGKCLACIVLAAAAVALPWQLYILQVFPKEAGWEYPIPAGIFSRRSNHKAAASFTILTA